MPKFRKVFEASPVNVQPESIAPFERTDRQAKKRTEYHEREMDRYILSKWKTVAIVCVNGITLTGTIIDAGVYWILLDTVHGECLLNKAHIINITPVEAAQ